MEFEWDDAKRLSNIEKHGIDFRDALDVFDARPRKSSGRSSMKEVLTLPAMKSGSSRTA